VLGRGLALHRRLEGALAQHLALVARRVDRLDRHDRDPKGRRCPVISRRESSSIAAAISGLNGDSPPFSSASTVSASWPVA
jgi:predicted component of type VI protein secretion system